MGAMSPASKEGDHDIQRENDQRSAYKAFANGVHAFGKAKVEKDDRTPKKSDGKSVSEGIQQPKLHTLAPGALNAGNVRNCSQMIVVESMSQTEQRTGQQGEFER